VPAVQEWLGTTESYYESKASGFPEEELREKGLAKSGGQARTLQIL